MKKTTPYRSKLTLPKQTLRVLDTVEVKEVRGGVGAVSVVANGNGNCGPTGGCKTTAM